MNNKRINYFAFAILTLLWAGFFAALVINPASLDSAWQAFTSWNLIIKLVVGLLALPLVAALWVWQNSWPLLLRLLLVAGLAWVTIYTFFPKRAAAQSGHEPA